MNYRNVGNSGLKISEIALGAWLTYGGSVAEKKATPIIHAAIEAGVNFIDVADIYTTGEAELVVGKAIKEMKRSDLVISSKVFWPMSDNINDRGLSRKHIFESVDKSLTRLGIDYLDIYYCHRWDEQTPVEETARAMSDLVQAGKVLYWGTSCWEADQIDAAFKSAPSWSGHRPAVEQPRYNLLDMHIEESIMPFCAKNGIGFTVWSPLSQGILTGKYNDGAPQGSRGKETKWLENDMTESNLNKVRVLGGLADELGISLAQLSIAWVLSHPEISCAIIGATSVEQLKENLGASDVTLNDDTLAKIKEIMS